MISIKNNQVILLVIFLFIGISSVQSQVVRSQVTSWIEIIDATDLVLPNEAGSDLQSSVETISNYTQLDIFNVRSSENWKITVSKQDINWDPALIAFVRRNGIGTACGSCTGVNVGSSAAGYVQISDFEQDFILGTGAVSGIDLQFMIEGISLTLDADYYRTKVVFTLYADP